MNIAALCSANTVLVGWRLFCLSCPFYAPMMTNVVAPNIPLRGDLHRPAKGLTDKLHIHLKLLFHLCVWFSLC